MNLAGNPRAIAYQLKRLTTEFQDTLAALGTDVDQIKRDLAALTQRLAALEDVARKVFPRYKE